MKKKTEIILVTSILLMAIAWRLMFWSEGVYGSDIFYHYTVVEQALANNKLANDNHLAVCFEGAKTGHPVGYYLLPYLLAKIVGLDVAFIVTPIFLGVLGLLTYYIFIKYIFNRKVALWTIAFLALTLAHISKSFPFSYRGENLIMPFLFLSLIGLYKMLIERKRKYSLLAGAASGIACFLWNGYPLVIIIYIVTIFLYLIYGLIKKEKNMGQNIRDVALSLVIQAFFITIILLTTEMSGKGLIFGTFYYPFLIAGSLMGLGVLCWSHKKQSYLPIVGAILVAIIAAIFFMDKIAELAGGFGSIQVEGIKTGELYSTKWYQYFFGLHILGILAIFGVYNYVKKFNKGSVLFLGVVLPSIYLVFSASRYIYFASFALVTLASFFLTGKKKIGKKFDVFIMISIATFLIILIYSFSAVPLYFAESRFIQNTDPFLFLKENTPVNACVIHTGERGAAIEYFAKRYYYLHSLGNVLEREKKAALFLLDNTTRYLDPHVTHIFLYYQDLIMMNRFNTKANLSEIGFFRITATEEDTESEQKVVDELSFMQTVHINGRNYINESGVGCYFQYKEDEFYMKRGVCDTHLFKMIANQPIQGFKNVYYKEGYTIYEVTKDLVKKE